MNKIPSRGEIWLINFNPTMGREQKGIRPGVIISENMFNHGPADLAIVLPLTTTDRGIPLHVTIEPPEGGLEKRSFVLCDQIRTISRIRLIKMFGDLEIKTVEEVENRLKILLDLH